MIYIKTKDLALINSFTDYVNNYAEDKDKAMTIFKRSIYLDDLNSYLRNKTQQIIDVGIGNVGSKIVIILEEKNKEHMDFYKLWLTSKGIPLYDVYLTFHIKGKKECYQDYDEVLIKEIIPFKDCFIINHSDIIPTYPHKHIDNNKFIYMMDLIKKQKDTTIIPEESAALGELKQEYWDTVKEALNYKTF